AKLDRLVACAKAAKHLLLSLQIFISEMANFPGMKEVWDAWVAQGATPPRATVEANLANPACHVEVVVVAAQCT
ncbi:Rid family hydrolase, partial [Burkholderia thailandensis]|uniref:Rid family hydrolase n=1 Tax=Burkholderia thailandensis TaxID=57975 RepID=UPI00217E25A5